MDMQTLARKDEKSSSGVHGIIDIRGYAARVAPTRDWLTGRATPAFADDAATVTAIAPVGEGRVAALRSDELVHVPSGEIGVETPRGGRNHTDYRSATGEFVCGTWDSTPYHRRAMLYRHIELMHLLEGAVTFQDDSGSATFSKGAILLAARGAQAAWISEVQVKKVYATHRPA